MDHAHHGRTARRSGRGPRLSVRRASSRRRVARSPSTSRRRRRSGPRRAARGRCAGIHRHARASARAGISGEGNDRDRYGGRGRAAGLPPSHACRTRDPPLDDPRVLLTLIGEAQRWARCRVFPIGAITRGRAGVELLRLRRARATRARSRFRDDGDTVPTQASCATPRAATAVFRRLHLALRGRI